MTDTVLAQLSALKTMPIADLKQKWRDLFEREPPVFNRRYIESRLAYRIQELAYGGPPAETVARLEALGEQLSKARRAGKKPTDDRRPISGTRLIREWNGVEHCVTVRDHDYEYMGRPYKSLSAVARTIAGSRWNGWVFFGLRNQAGR
jgi:hypothetical protein